MNPLDYVTYYRDEDGVPPALVEAMDWADKTFFKVSQMAQEIDFWVAGGCLRSFFLGQTPKDYDLYCRDEKHRDSLIQEFARSGLYVGEDNEWSSKFHKAFDVDDGITYDVIKWYSDTPEETLAEFDFTVACCAISRDAIVYHKDYFVDLATKKLRINSLARPVSVLRRMQKYNDYGFKMGDHETMRLARAISLIDFDEKLDSLTIGKTELKVPTYGGF